MHTHFRTLALVLASATLALANDGTQETNHTHAMTLLALQLGALLFAARLGGRIFGKLQLPAVLGELVSGMVVGPFLLGSIPLPGLPHGLFPLAHGALPVSLELYGFATIASILLLFMAGIETDLKLFLRFSLAGSAVGVGGVIVSFMVGASTAAWLLHIPFMDPKALFLGVMSTATSVGITVRILSEKKKLDSPEGVTILAGAVIDDILGIVLLAIVVGISAIGDTAGAQTDWGAISSIGAKAIGAWLAFTALGLFFAERIAALLHRERSPLMLSILSFGLALLVAGVFEFSGLAMIIGAYVMGLSLSKTDLKLTIQENLDPLHHFFVPIFFATMGMLVDVTSIFQPQLLWIGGIYTIGAILSKVVGSGLPALLLGFNRLGALRIGTGMIPRGEVALIIAGIGLAHGILDQSLFSIAVIMTLVTTLAAPILLSKLLVLGGRGTHEEVIISETALFEYPVGDTELTDLVQHKILQFFVAEGFVMHRVPGEKASFHLQRKHSSIVLTCQDQILRFESAQQDQFFIKALLHETLLDITAIMDKVKQGVRPQELQNLLSQEAPSSAKFDFRKILRPECVVMKLAATTKETVIEELLACLHTRELLPDLDAARKSVWYRERAMSTGIQHGFAIPHGRIQGIDNLRVVIGISEHPVDFDSMDGLNTHVFVLTLIPTDRPVPYVQFLAALNSALSTPEKVLRVRSMRFRHQVLQYFIDSGDARV